MVGQADFTKANFMSVPGCAKEFLAAFEYESKGTIKLNFEEMDEPTAIEEACRLLDELHADMETAMWLRSVNLLI